MLAYAPAVLFFLLFCVGVLRDRRRFSNAVLLGLSLTFAAAAWLVDVTRTHAVSREDLGITLLVVAALSVMVLAWFLISNGVTMVRKEGRSPANFLSLLTGITLVALIALLITAAVLRTRILLVAAGTAVALTGYVAFLFLSFIGYGFLYGFLNFRRRADFVVVLGSGLVGGSKVPPLLAGRLERALVLHRRMSTRGRRPVLLVSGGQGPDEELPESHAMADYLLARDVPAALIAREDRSTTTEENLRFSRSIMEKENAEYRCVIVTNNYHAFRAAVISRQEGIRGHVVGSPTAGYFWPSAMIREFVAIVVTYWRINLAICSLFFFGGVAIWQWS